MSFNLTFARMPTEIRDFVEKAWSLNTSGVPDTNECPDFKLEAVNKMLQHWLPKVPAGIDWQMCCCEFDCVSFETHISIKWAFHIQS